LSSKLVVQIIFHHPPETSSPDPHRKKFIKAYRRVNVLFIWLHTFVSF